MCGLSYHGTAYTTKNKAGSTLHRYYVHSEQFRSDVCFKTIQADMIESACFRAISFVFSSAENLKQAIERALTNGSNRKEDLHEQIEHLRSCLTELNSEKNRLIKAMVKGVVSEDDIASEMTRIRKETIEIEQQLKEQIEYLAKLEVDLPDDLHVRVQAVITALTEQEGTNMLEWSEESLSRLLQWFFGVNKENGIYIKRDEENNVCFQIKGMLSCSTIGVVEESTAGIMLAGLDDLNQTFDHTSTQADFNDLIQKCLDSKTSYS